MSGRERARQLQNWGRAGRKGVCCTAGEIVAGVCCTLCRGCQAGELPGSVPQPVPCRDMTASTRPHRTGARETWQKEQSTIQTGSAWGLLPHEHHTPNRSPTRDHSAAARSSAGPCTRAVRAEPSVAPQLCLGGKEQQPGQSKLLMGSPGPLSLLKGRHQPICSCPGGISIPRLCLAQNTITARGGRAATDPGCTRCIFLSTCWFYL